MTEHKGCAACALWCQGNRGRDGHGAERKEDPAEQSCLQNSAAGQDDALGAAGQPAAQHREQGGKRRALFTCNQMKMSHPLPSELGS